MHEVRPTSTKPTSVAIPSLTSHSTFYKCLRGILCQLQPSQSFDDTGCDYFLFPMPGKKDHITIDIHYSLEHHNGIHTEEVDLLDLKELNDLPSGYPFFHLPYQIDMKVTCTGVYVCVEIIYIDSSPDQEIFYSEPSDETIRRLYGIPSAESYTSDYGSHDRQESSISSQSVEYCLRYKHQSAA